jgi:protein gp37
MGKNTKISWATHTFNPWEGCQKIYVGDAPSECENCYAEARNKRFNGGRNWGAGTLRSARSDSYWQQPLKWDRAAAKAGERHRVFCASLADWAERHDVPAIDDWMYGQRRRLFDLILATPNLDWLLLSKRPENFAAFLPWGSGPAWTSVWLGVTAGTQAAADLRIPILLNTSAAVRFVSCEPLLEPIYLSPYLRAGIDQVIVGCESGFGARPFNLDWVRSVRGQCITAGVPFFLKQIPVPGRHGKVETEPELDGHQWLEFPR